MDYELEPVKLMVHLLFGNQDETSGWVKDYSFSSIPTDGAILAIPLSHGNEYQSEKIEDLMASPSLYTQIIYSNLRLDDTDESNPIVIVYGGLDLPDLDLTTFLEEEDWEQLDQVTTEVLMTLCLEAPPSAGVHNILLIIGEPTDPDFQVWEQIYEPHDTEVLPFGSRVNIDPVDSMTLFDPVIRDDKGFFNERSINVQDEGSLDEGLNVIVIHSEVIGPGVADIIYWAKDLGEINGLDLISEGWSQIKVPEDFDPEAIDISARISLALMVSIIWVEDKETNEFDQDGLPPLKWSSCEIDNPSEIHPSLYRLLPYPLIEKCRASRIAAGLSLEGDTGDENASDFDDKHEGE